MKTITIKEFRRIVSDAMIAASIDLKNHTYLEQNSFPKNSRHLFAYPSESGYIYFPKSQNKTIEIKDGFYVQLKDKDGRVYEFSFLAPIVF